MHRISCELMLLGQLSGMPADYGNLCCMRHTAFLESGLLCMLAKDTA